MKKNFPVPRLDRVVAVLDGSPKLENPYNVQNLRLQGYDYWMRYGYTTIQPKQTNFEAVYGLGWAQGVSQISTESSPTPKEEVVTIEGIGDPEVIRPYSRMVLNPVNTTTFAPTQIGTTTLTSGKWGFASYNDCIYAICPGADKLTPPKPTVYKHLIGETTGVNAWTEVQNSSYSAPPSDPILLVNTFPSYENSQRGFLATDTVTFSGAGLIHPGTETYTIAANRDMQIGGTSDNYGIYHDAVITVDFTANPSGVAEDWSTYGYVGISLYGIWVRDFKQFFNVQVKIGGVWTTVESKAYYGNEAIGTYDRLFGVLRIKGVSGNNAVQGFRFSITSGGTNYVSGHALTLEKLYVGGNFLEAKASSSRIWFPNGSTTPATTGGYNTGIKYGVRFTHSSGTPVPSNADIETITASQAQGTYILPAYFDTQFSIGGVVSLSISPQNTATYNKIQFLRQMEDGVTWKLLSEQNNTGTSLITVYDTKEEHELTSLTTVTVTANATPPSAPTFRTAGIVGAFSYKQSMVWLVNQTSKNIQFSRVGDPLELFDTARIYGETDNTVPAQYTLADDQADVPVWGTQAGVSAFIIGKYAAYAMVGDYPKAMSPSRQIPGSRGIVGCYAGTRFRNAEGIWGAAYADQDLNIWVVNSVPAFIEDASAKPQEISLPIRGKLKDFLYTQQKIEISNLDITNTKLVFEEEESSLWVMLGKRAAVFRQDMVGNGWELYDYTMSSNVTVSTCTPYFTNGAIAHDYDGGDSTWSNFGYPFASDNSYCLNAFGLPSSPSATTARTTKHLRCHSYLPSPLIPTNATITNVRWKVEDSKVGDLEVTQNVVQPTVNNVSYGSNLSTNRIVTTSDVEEVYNLAPPLPSVSDINAGHLGIDLQYTQEVWNSNWNDPANYDISVSSETPIPEVSCTHTITVTYTHGGTPPPYAYIDITSFVEAYLAVINNPALPIPWSATQVIADNGIDNIVQGTASVDTLNPPVTVISNSTKRVKVILTSGVGSNIVNASVSGTIVLPNPNTNNSIGVVGNFSASATFSPVVPSTVRVDNVAAQVCYTVINTGTDVQWSQVNFSPNGKYLGFRSTGELDIIEKDFRTGLFIGGTNRDSGLAPSNWFFTTQAIQWDGSKARLASVQYHGQNYTDVVDVAVSVDDSAYVSGTLEGVVTSKWYKFHPSVSSGIRHNVKITGSESDATLKGYTLEFSVQSRGKPR